MTSRKAIADALMDRHGRTFCAELGIDIAKNTAAPLFQWLIAANLYSTRISNRLAEAGALSLLCCPCPGHMYLLVDGCCRSDRPSSRTP